MSCDHSTGPVDIKQRGIMPNRCHLKCNFIYQYNVTNVIASNKNTYLSLKLTNNNANVAYHSNRSPGNCNSNGAGGGKYNIKDIRIYSPSLHKYDNKNADAELIIYHTNIAGGKDLIVCVPISVNHGSLPNATTQIASLINDVSRIANKSGSNANIQGLSFNLNDFIPRQKFYSYVASLPYYPCTSCIDYIVFDVDNGAISISPSVLRTLKQIISPEVTPIHKITKDLGFAYSTKKPIFGIKNSDENIFIDCQPTGSNGQVLISDTKSRLLNNFSFNLPTNLFDSINIYSLSFVVLILAIIFGLKHLLGYFNNLVNNMGSSDSHVEKTISNVKSGGNKLYKASKTIKNIKNIIAKNKISL